MRGCSWATCLPPAEKRSLLSLFFNRLFVFIVVELYTRFLSISELFSPNLWVVFSLSWQSFDAHKFLILMRSSLPVFSLVACIFGVIFCTCVSAVLAPFVERPSFAHGMILPLWESQLTRDVWIYFWTVGSIPLIPVCILILVLYTVWSLQLCECSTFITPNVLLTCSTFAYYYQDFAPF